MTQHGKKIRNAREAIERTKLYKLDDAVKLVKTNASAKFDETVEIAINLGGDPKHADQMVRGVVNLPNGTGRTLRVEIEGWGDPDLAVRDADALGHQVADALSNSLTTLVLIWPRASKVRSNSILPISLRSVVCASCEIAKP